MEPDEYGKYFFPIFVSLNFETFLLIKSAYTFKLTFIPPPSGWVREEHAGEEEEHGGLGVGNAWEVHVQAGTEPQDRTGDDWFATGNCKSWNCFFFKLNISK